MTFAQKVKRFYHNLSLEDPLPQGIEVLNPYRDPDIQPYVEKFLDQFFNDTNSRVLVFGINPGRFGAGLTGIGFTDPVALEESCGIANSLLKKRELSSRFVYQFIQAWGGVEKFYDQFFLTAVCPLGFVHKGKNYNYYDHPQLWKAVGPFIRETIRQQAAFGRRQAAILLGTGQNQKFFGFLNQKDRFFDKIYGVDHPRFVMQYRRRHIKDYIEKYRLVFAQALEE